MSHAGDFHKARGSRKHGGEVVPAADGEEHRLGHDGGGGRVPGRAPVRHPEGAAPDTARR